MKIPVMVLLGLASVLSALAQVAPSSGAITNAADHSAVGNPSDESYQLEANDVISVQIKEDRKAATNLVVTDSGEIHAPYLGRVEVAGKTCKEVAAELKVLLEKDYYYKATVIVGLDTKSRVGKVEKVIGKVTIWGEVRSPGTVDIVENHSLKASEAILRVGGVTDNGDKKKVRILRTNEHGATITLPLNLHDVMDKGKTDKDIELKPNDYIIVGSRLIRF